jgi:hypothetical protein
MLLLIIILSASAIGVALISWLLTIFVKKVLKGRNDLLARVLIGLLVIQFILGMLANLFAQIPTVEPYVVWHYFGPILLHTLNGLFLLILSIIFIIHAIRVKKFVRPGIAGAVAIAIAIFCGVTFVNAGQNNVYSFIMSLGFIVAFIVYTYIAFTSLGAKTKT